MKRSWPLGLLLALACSVGLGQSRDEKKREQAVEKLAKKLGVPAAELSAVSGERYAAREAPTRKALLVELAQRPRGPLLPLVTAAALEEADFENKRVAVRLITVVGLDADRALVIDSALPALTRLFGDRSELVW